MLVGWLVLLFWPAPGGGAGLVLPFVNGASPSLVQHEILHPAPPGSPTPPRMTLAPRDRQAYLHNDRRGVTLEGPGGGKTFFVFHSTTFEWQR